MSGQHFPGLTPGPLLVKEPEKAYLGAQPGNELLPPVRGVVPTVPSQEEGRGLEETGVAGRISSPIFAGFTGARGNCFCVH